MIWEFYGSMYICKLGLSYVVHVHTTVHVNADPSMVYNVQLNNESRSQETLRLNKDWY